jgi:hypothetical protein
VVEHSIRNRAVVSSTLIIGFVLGLGLWPWAGFVDTMIVCVHSVLIY